MTKDVALICDDKYCLPTAICIQSIIDNSILDCTLTVHVCTSGLSADSIQIIEGLSCDKVHVEINTFEGEYFENKFKSVSQKTHVTPTALIKFELPNYFYYLDSLLYVDSDIIIKGNLSDLLNFNLADVYLAASYEFWKYVNATRYNFSKYDKVFYFNSGVMLLNLRKMRDDKIPEKLWDYKLNKTKTKLMDQESLNAICGIKVECLPLIWNFNPIFLNSIYLQDINKVYGSSYKDLVSLESDVKIIHYVGKHDKPWIYKNAHMRKYWDESCKKVFSLENIKKGLKDAEKTSFSSSVASIMEKNGIPGLLSYMIYAIKLKLGKKC